MDLADNELILLDDLLDKLFDMKKLKSLNLSENPLNLYSGYQYKAIGKLNLEFFDDKAISG